MPAPMPPPSWKLVFLAYIVGMLCGAVMIAWLIQLAPAAIRP